MRKIIVIIGAIKKGNKYLLTKRVHRDKEFNKKWQLPGGALENNETIVECLKREIKEETNLELIKNIFIPKIFEKTFSNWHGIFISYLCYVDITNKVVLDDEASDYEWYSLDEIFHLNTLLYTYNIAYEAELLSKKNKSARGES